MKKYEQDRARLDASRLAIPRISQEVSIPDVEMESVGSHHTRSNHYDMEDLGPEDLRRPLVANAEIAPSSGIAPQRIRMSAIADLQEFTGRDTDEDRARS